jgi:nicotinate-nucleotide adenylyltransferase
VIGLFGGAFDPPHIGHVELVRAAKEQLGLDPVLIVVAAAPGHKAVELPADRRLELARAAFPDDQVVLDEHARTIDTLRARPEWHGAVFLVGADEFADFPAWKEPDEVLRLVRMGVATRPGYPRERLQSVLELLGSPDRVLFFDLAPIPVSSRELRERLDRGDDVHELIPPAVWGVIERDGLYERQGRYTQRA